MRLRSSPSFVKSSTMRCSCAVGGKSTRGAVSRATLPTIQVCTARARSLISCVVKRSSGSGVVLQAAVTRCYGTLTLKNIGSLFDIRRPSAAPFPVNVP